MIDRKSLRYYDRGFYFSFYFREICKVYYEKEM